MGERIDIPGAEITDASKRLWHQGLFSSVKITVEKVAGDKAWIAINLREQPRISAINYIGTRKRERKDHEEKLQLHKKNKRKKKKMSKKREQNY